MPGISMKTGALLATALLLSACGTHPVLEQPRALAPDSFSGSGEQTPPAHWWISLDDPALTGWIEQALAANRSLRASRARLQQARALARRQGAPRWPSLSATGEAARERDSDDNTQELFSAGASASWELDLWGRVRNSARAAAFDARASQASLQDAAISLSAEVALTWYQLQESRLQQDLLNTQLEINHQVEEVIRLRFRQGQVGVSDVLRQEQLVEQTRGNLVDARRTEDNLRLRLAVLAGQVPGGLSLAAPPALATLPPLPDTGVPATLLERRPDVRAALLSVRAEDRRVAAAIANRFPRIDLSASISDTAVSAGDLFSDWVSRLAAQLTIPLIDGGQRRAEVDRSRAALAVAVNQYEQTVLEALSEVEDALSAERRQHAKLASLEKQLTLSRQALSQLRTRYTQGATDYLNVLDALVSQQELERQVLAARRQLLANRITLYRTLAGGWDISADVAPETDHADRKDG